MGLLMLLGIVMLFMIADDRRIKKDIYSASEMEWTKMDAEIYYHNELKSK